MSLAAQRSFTKPLEPSSCAPAALGPSALIPAASSRSPEPGHQRRLRADHGEVDGLLPREGDQAVQIRCRQWTRIRPPPRCPHCRARNRALSRAGSSPAPRPAHVPGPRSPPARRSRACPFPACRAVVRAGEVQFDGAMYHEWAMSEAANQSRANLPEFQRQRDFRRPQADGGGRLSLCPGARRDQRPEQAASGHIYFDLKDEKAVLNADHLAADRARKLKLQARAGHGSGLHRPDHDLCRLLALSAHRRAGGTGRHRRADGDDRGAQEEARRRRPVRRDAQAPAALPAGRDRRRHLADGRGDPRHHAPAPGALSPAA